MENIVPAKTNWYKNILIMTKEIGKETDKQESYLVSESFRRKHTTKQVQVFFQFDFALTVFSRRLSFFGCLCFSVLFFRLLEKSGYVSCDFRLFHKFHQDSTFSGFSNVKFSLPRIRASFPLDTSTSSVSCCWQLLALSKLSNGSFIHFLTCTNVPFRPKLLLLSQSDPV